MIAGDRIVKITNYLNVSIKELSEKCGYKSPQVFYDVQNGKTRNISSVMCDKIISAFPIFNRIWLITGDGSMLTKTANQQTAGYESTSFIRYWTDIDAMVGSICFNDINSEHIKIKLPNFADCTDAVKVYSNNMLPTYQIGDIIILCEWKENFINFGHVYLVITKSGNRMIKRLDEGNSTNCVKCVSDNPEFSPFEIEKSDISRLYSVKGCIRRNEM